MEHYPYGYFIQSFAWQTRSPIPVQNGAIAGQGIVYAKRRIGPWHNHQKNNAKYGVVVAAAASNDEHAKGTMSPQRAAEIARRAGIITPSGNLPSLYK